MAKKRKASKPRRRVGAVRKGGNVGTALQVLAGAVAARVVINSTSGILRNDMLRSAAPAVVGFLLPRFIKGPIGQNIGTGMIVGSGLSLASKLNLPLIGGAPFVAGALPYGNSYSAPMVAGTPMQSGVTASQVAYVS
jgi:hypothetical protein